MAITRAETQVTWPTAANSISVTSGSNQTSEGITLDDTCVGAAVTLKADNDGTPAAGDTIDFYILYSAGDPDGAAADEYDTPGAGHPQFLAKLDTNTEDPAITTVPISHVPKKAKIYASSNAATNSITVSATIEEQRAA